jgi:predicted nucleic acid-binding protein
VSVVDASVWVASFLSDDVHHARSLQWIVDQTSSRSEILIPTLALAEIAGALARRTNSTVVGQRAIGLLLALPTLHLIPLDDAVGKRASELASTCRLRGADAVDVAVAQAHGSILITWDAEVAARAGALVRVLQPT